MKLYTNESSDPKYNAQRNLEGRTHYVDDATLRFHKARIITTAITDGGLLFALVESYTVDTSGSSRAFRPVIFDVFGNVKSRPSLEGGYTTSKKAISAMWELLNSLDAFAVTEEGIKHYLRCVDTDMKVLRDDMARLKEKAA